MGNQLKGVNDFKTREKTPVLVVGASPVVLALAVELNYIGHAKESKRVGLLRNPIVNE